MRSRPRRPHDSWQLISQNNVSNANPISKLFIFNIMMQPLNPNIAVYRLVKPQCELWLYRYKYTMTSGFLYCAFAFQMQITWGLVYHKGTCHKDTCNMVTKFLVWILDNSIMLDKLLSRRQIFVCAFLPIYDKNKCTRPVSGIPFIRYVSGIPFIRYFSGIPFIRYAQNGKIGSKII